MATRKPQQAPLVHVVLDRPAMVSAIKKLDRRLDDLRNFDPATVNESFSSEASALQQKVNTTLQEFLPANTIEYRDYHVSALEPMSFIIGEPKPVYQVRADLAKGVGRAVDRLTVLRELLAERLEEAEDMAGPRSVAPRAPAIREHSRKVFVVHGHDAGLKEAVARVLAGIDLEPLILHELPNKGQTIIEKFETNADVGFAVVLFTGDDLGHPADQPDQQMRRPRQNVVFELGYFTGKLGRGRVCVLHAGGLEMPSDISGVVYIPVDPSGAWRYLLAKEISAAGIEVDLNKVR